MGRALATRAKHGMPKIYKVMMDFKAIIPFTCCTGVFPLEDKFRSGLLSPRTSRSRRMLVVSWIGSWNRCCTMAAKHGINELFLYDVATQFEIRQVFSSICSTLCSFHALISTRLCHNTCFATWVGGMNFFFRVLDATLKKKE
jgi:hypothetical protein